MINNEGMTEDQRTIAEACRLMEEWDALSVRGLSEHEEEIRRGEIYNKLGKTLGACETCYECGKKLDGWYGTNICEECVH